MGGSGLQGSCGVVWHRSARATVGSMVVYGVYPGYIQELGLGPSLGISVPSTADQILGWLISEPATHGQYTLPIVNNTHPTGLVYVMCNKYYTRQIRNEDLK